MADFHKPLTNRYDPFVMKGKLDEFITHFLSNRLYFPENNSFSNKKLIIGFIATFFTIYAHVYEYLYLAPFPKNYNILLICCVCYFILNFSFQIIDYWVQGDIFFSTNPLYYLYRTLNMHTSRY